ncbi:ABC transporter ATP-binding protein [Clostridium senegalense]|uniref:ABC transporter ATP-binding protein n=1 Tax=Clostridium senegalense TaxID=1465809 RepID=UPI001C123283|nr:ABC transporter ATP-binding protein [Clostridium senegalense]MBU5225927.1 ABC transporter ATP-binding protein [Clostridium senegalense]
MKKPILEFKDFSVQYIVQAKPTLKNINLTIYEGEKVLIVGPSGCGKSTLSNCINGLIPFSYKAETTGSLKIKGKEANELSIFEISTMVGTVLQDPDSQFIGLTVGEDIAFKLENYCVMKKNMKDKVENVSRLVDINSHLYSSPHNLSGGQKQRVTLAGAIIDDVDILLFDEPLASLDPASGKTSIELIDKIQKETNKTVLIIEHRLEDVLHCDVDRIIIMNDGVIMEDTTPNKLLASNILIENGIREPLYITALKYAGCHITEEMNAKNVEIIDINECKEKLNSWYLNSVDKKKKEKNKSILELQNVSFQYNEEKQILKDVSFSIYKGDMVSIVGKNGAGKSTISKLICGFYKPTTGKIFFDGIDIEKNTIKERAEKIGMVMQNPNQMISKTMIFDEVALGLKVRGIGKEEIEERVYKTLKICGLYEYRNWPISALSFGQKKRVTIASILVLNPEIIILDEPTAGQDFKHYNEIMEFLLELNKKGVTIIMITHDMHLMLEYSNKAIVLSQGEKIADDLSMNILTDHRIIEAANLKETSLQKLALKSNIDNPKKFIERFIEEDRGERK